MLMLGRKTVSPLCMPYAGIEKATNCILEIPQNIKLEINSTDGLVLKSGSIITLSGSTYTTYTTTSNKSIKSVGTGKRVIFLTQSNYAPTAFNINNITSGTTDSRAGEGYHVWFDTENKLIKAYTTSGDTVAYTCSYPLCVVETDSSGNVVSFAKDSNGNDMIFNGAGFVGHHAFIYPNVKALIPNGFDANNEPINIQTISSSLLIRELDNNSSSSFYKRCIYISSIGYIAVSYYAVLNSLEEISHNSNYYSYIPSYNHIYHYNNNELEIVSNRCYFISYQFSNDIMVDFTIQPPLTKYKWVVKLIP